MCWALTIIRMLAVVFLSPRALTASAIAIYLKVLRVYDTRFRRSDRRPNLYLDPNCSDIVGGDVKTVLEIPDHVYVAPENLSVTLGSVAAPIDNAASQDCDPHGRKNFFAESLDKRMLVIATPFRNGQHVAQHPGDFLPIIQHLEKIHKAGYVHGDIRSCNAAFPETEGGQSYLIDFDFSGKAGQAVYPLGYNLLLPDGYRMGFGKAKIKMWHDWHALGRLIFEVHRIRKPEAEEEQTLWSMFLDCKEYWTTLETDPPARKIHELKKVLSEVHARGWMVQAGPTFQQWLDMVESKDLMTKHGATGSPSKAHIDLLVKWGEGVEKTKNA